MIILKDVNVSLKKNETLLREINLAVRRGETFVVIGPSGGGKSVLMKVIAGLISPRSGQVQLDPGHSLGMVFQRNALFDSLSVRENLAFPLRESSDDPLNEEAIQKRVLEGLREVDLENAADLFPSEISGGMQKRLGIARGHILRPDIIIYDDPTAGLDPITSKMIIDLIIKLKNEWGTTAIVVTNDMNRARQLGGRAGMVVDQTFLNLGTMAEAQDSSDPRVRDFLCR